MQVTAPFQTAYDLAPAEDRVPLCVDLDGTLIRTDLLFESLLNALRRQWWIVFLLPVWLMRGRAKLKQRIAAFAQVDASLLPYRVDLLTWLRREREQGRRLILATGSNHKFATAVARHLGLFSEVIASDGSTNLTGKAKAAQLLARFGEAGYDYVGDSSADTAVWDRARRKIAAGPRVHRLQDFDRVFADHSGTLKPLIRALRPKHWVKNLLVFVPIIAGHRLLDLNAFWASFAAFVAFSMAASAVYVVNDLIDLPSDRKHPIKRRRPFAAGDLSIQMGLAIAPVLLLIGLGMAAALGAATFGALLVYLAITFIYTFYLKRKLLADVFALAILYTLRMLVGGAASGVLCSTWLLAFSVFQFLSLAFLKRSAELSGLARNRGEEVAGRSYFTWDLVQVNVFGVTAAYLSSLVLGLYIAGDRVRILYQQPGWLWMLVPLHLYWMSRAWILSHRGAMNEDPITFAVTDRSTWLCAGISAILLTLATLGGLSFPGVAQ